MPWIAGMAAMLVAVLMGVSPVWGQSAWNGTTTMYTNPAAAGIAGSGTEAAPYIIDNADKFVAFGFLAHNSTAYWRLTADIDLGGHEWPYSGNTAKTFKGHFDGQSHTVSHYTITPASGRANGLFAVVEGTSAARAEIKNLNISNVTVSSSANLSGGTHMAAFVGNVSKYVDLYSIQVSDVAITIANKISAENNIGAFVGTFQKNSTITNCSVSNPSVTVSGEITTKACFIGGAIGRFAGSSAEGVSAISGLNVTSPTVTINKVTYKDSYIGGVIGQVNSYSTVDNVSISDAELTYNAADSPNVALNLGSFAGGILGAASQQTSVTNVTISDGSDTDEEAAKVVIGTGSNNVKAVKAGLIGQAATNVRLEKWSIGNTNVEIKGSLTDAASHIGGFAGYLVPQDAVDAKLVTSDITITGKASISVSGNISIANCHIGGFVGYLQGRSKTGSLNSVRSVSVEAVDLTISGNISVVTNIGGMVGYVYVGCEIADCVIKDPKLDLEGTISAASNIGGAIGNFSGAAGYPSLTTDITVTGLDITLNTNFTAALYVGGIAGQLVAIDGTPNKIEKCSAGGKIHSTGSHTFKQGNVAYAFGGIVGYTGQGLSSMSEIRKCVSEVDFDLGGMTPEVASGSNYNLYQNGMVVGGVVGRINTPSRMPENLFYSGKIYAPFAAVGPIVGVFLTSIGNASYIYDDYSANTYAVEWDKTKGWYYSNYKIGLSDAVLDQTQRTRNFTTTPVVEDGVSYLDANEASLIDRNAIDGNAKFSRTVLPYIKSGGNISNDKYIFPAWNTNNATYPAYYMYFMQGINVGSYRVPESSELVKALVMAGKCFNPQIQVSGDNAGGHVFTVVLGDIDIDGEIGLAYQWYEADKTTLIAGETTQTLALSNTELENAGQIVCCKVTFTVDEGEPFSIMLSGWAGGDVVYVDAKNGIDNDLGSKARGWTPATAVKTLDHANSLLKTPAEGGSWDNNIIVIIGELSKGSAEANCFKSRGTNPATITGKYNGVDYGGIINLVKGVEAGANPGDGPGRNGLHNYVSADTKFENLILRAAHDVDNMFLELHGHDVWLGKGLRMQGFRNLSAGHGNLSEDSQTVPEFSIILTSTNPAHPDEAYWTRTKPQVLTIESGHYGRILGGRYVSGFFQNSGNTSHSILATAGHPAWAVVNIDIDPDNDVKSADQQQKTYTCDINCIVTGLTDGSIYGDYQINIHGGNVRYAVGANQGNSVVNGSSTFTPSGGNSGKWGQFPNASFFGRTIINVEPKEGLKPITINNLYAGGLGRNADANSSASTVVDMYIYGHTEINMKGGTVLGNVYGGGAGGVMGLNPWDAHVPYAATSEDNVVSAVINGVQYGDNRVTGAWSTKTASDAKADVVLHKIDGDGNFIVSETESLNLANSSTTLNISGGTIGGDVFGGGKGFVSNMPILGTMQGVGSVFGTSNINISGGTIGGSIYGGSEGHTGYYSQTNKYGQTISHIAEMNGTVNLNITGTDELWPTIGGNIYGGGAGGASTSSMEYLRIATTGNTDLGDDYASTINITIDLPESHPFLGNVYGGGEMGAVDGSTNITINGGVLGSVDDAGNVVNGNVFGAGKGEPGHPDKAKLTGETYVHVAMSDSDEILGNVYGGGELAQVEGTTHVDITSGPVRGDVYGGGSLADIVGSTEVDLLGGSIRSAYGGGLGARAGVDGATADVEAHVTLDTKVVLGGSIVSGDIFGCNNLNGTPRGHAFVDIRRTSPRPGQGASEYDLHAVYGGGNLAAYVPTDPNETTEVLVETCTNSIEDVFGGGNAADAPNTDVTIWGGIISRVFAGGNGEVSAADVAGNTSLKVYGGTIGEVYGGSNTNGTIGGQISVEVRSDGKDGDEACPMHLGSVYGGGNLAASSAGHMVIGCTGEGEIEAVYGGANKADIDGDVELHIVGGRINNVFGGNNISGSISGSISVVVDWDGSCSNNRIENVYGGGNLADYAAPALDPDYPKVYVRNAVVEQNVFGGGKGIEGLEKGKVTGNPHVRIGSSEAEESGSGHAVSGHQVTVGNSVYGGGNAAPVVGKTHVVADGSAIGGKCDGQFKGGDVHGIFVKAHVFGGGLGRTATVSSDTEVRITGQTTVGGNVYGGGNGGEVGGNTKVVIGQ